MVRTVSLHSAGAADGSVRAFDLSPQDCGRTLLALHVHTAAVCRLLPPPTAARAPWDGCVLTLAEDGAVCVVSLVSCACTRVFAGHPCAPSQVAWDTERGYLACLCEASGLKGQKGAPLSASALDAPSLVDQSDAVAILWDVHSGIQDRVTTGPRAFTVLRDLMQEVPTSQPHYAWFQQQTESKTNAGTVVTVDVHAMLRGVSGVGGKGNEVAALALTLSLLHWWGVEHVLDQQLYDMLVDLHQHVISPQVVESQPLSAAVSPAGSPAVSPGRRVRRPPTSFSRTLIPSAGPSVVEPTAQAALSGLSVIQSLSVLHSSSVRGGTELRSAAQQSAVSADLGTGIPSAISAHSASAAQSSDALGVASLTPATLQSQSEDIDLFLIGTTRSLQNGNLDETSTQPQPAGVQLVDLVWRDPEFVAQRLLALVALSKRLMTVPDNTRGDEQRERLAKACSAMEVFYLLQLREMVPAVAEPALDCFTKLFRDPNENLREAAQALHTSYSHSSPATVGGHKPFGGAILMHLWDGDSRGLSPDLCRLHALELLAVAEACSAKSAEAPLQLMACIVPSLITLACAAPSAHSATAAMLLSTALMGTSAGTWRRHVGDLPAFTDRVLGLCAKLGIGTVRPQRPTQQQAASSTIARLSLSSPPVNTAEAVATTGGGVSNRVSASATEVAACRDAASGLLSALAALDLPQFLHLAVIRMAGGTSPESVTHTLFFLALLRLAQSPLGRQCLARELQAVTATLMQGLDLDRPGLRRTCLPGVTAVVKEFCTRFPMVDYQASGMLLAVGSPFVAKGLSRHEGLAPGFGLGSGDVRGDAVAVFDMQAGSKTHALHYSHGEEDLEAVPALAFSPGGTLIAAYCMPGGALVFWNIASSWGQRLQRRLQGAGALLPAATLQVAIRWAQATQYDPHKVDQGYRLKWESESGVRILHGEESVAVEVPPIR